MFMEHTFYVYIYNITSHSSNFSLAISGIVGTDLMEMFGIVLGLFKILELMKLFGIFDDLLPLIPDNEEKQEEQEQKFDKVIHSELFLSFVVFGCYC